MRTGDFLEIHNGVSRKIHIKAASPEPLPEPVDGPRNIMDGYPRHQEVMDAVIGAAVETLCGNRYEVRDVGRPPTVVVVEEPDPTDVCKNCARKAAAL